MFLSYETYKNNKWCITLASKIEKYTKIPAEEIFTETNYELDKIYEFTNVVLDTMFKDSINTYKSGIGSEI